MRIARNFVLAIAAVAACSLAGCLLTNPQDGHTIQQGNDRIHFGGYGPLGDGFLVEARSPITGAWVQAWGQRSLFFPVLADGARAPSGEPRFITLSDGTRLYDWRDQFFVPPDYWTRVWSNGRWRWRAIVRARHAETGDVIVHTAANGSYFEGPITIYCDDTVLQRFPRW
jgi:hypothetical protein